VCGVGSGSEAWGRYEMGWVWRGLGVRGGGEDTRCERFGAGWCVRWVFQEVGLRDGCLKGRVWCG
jgi:hypothetical protein